jgi:mannonate dehydratase
MAHCASLGECTDLDNPSNQEISCFDLFLRMMDEERYEGLLYGDISAMLQYNRLPGPMMEILSRPDLHSRLVNGTDYPLVAINALIRTSDLEKDGFITTKEREYLNEIYDYNPLLFEFVLKRTIKLPGTEQQLSASIFFRDLLTVNK